MTRNQIDIQIFDPFGACLSEEWLRMVVDLTLDTESVLETHCEPKFEADAHTPSTIVIGLVVADDETLCSLNKEFRGYDEVTDVLSFPFLDNGQSPAQNHIPFVLPVDTQNVIGIHMGEVIVSYPQAMRQAKTAGHSGKQEIALLVAHGVLHLLGYDHATRQDHKTMWHIQDSILSNITFGIA